MKSVIVLGLIFCISFIGAQEVTNPVTETVEIAETTVTTGAVETTASTEDPAPPAEEHTTLDFIWILVATALVFLMQAGFMFLESGFAQAKNSINVAVKNISDFILAVACFWVVGYGLMFGASFMGLFGSDNYFFSSGNSWDSTVFLFQAVFCGTAATITSGAIAGRTKFLDYIILSVLISSVIYPIFGHWVWGGGWLSELGFSDFAGSTVVHSVGGWVALAGIIVIGPRLTKFDENGNPRKLPPHSILSAYLGGLILFFGWFGFNCGSTLAATPDVAPIAMNTVLAACFGGISGMFLSWKFGELKLPEPEYIINGVLGGLVGITAGCDAVSTSGAVIIGITSGIASYYGVHFLERVLKLDDVVGAVAVHGICGAWGTVIFPVFTDNPEVLSQLGVQVLGVAVCFAWTFPIAFVILKIIKKIWGLRIPADMELQGLNVSEHGVRSTLLDLAQSMHEVRAGKNITHCEELEFQKGTEMGDLAEGYNAMLKTIKNSLKESALQKEIAETAQMKAELALEKIYSSQDALKSALEKAEASKNEAREALKVSEEEKLKNKESLQRIEAEREKTEQLLDDLREREKLANQQKEFLERHTNDAGETANMITDAISRISSEGKRVIKDIDQLAEKTKSLSTQLDGLTEISETTRFLSFNASIEAATSGEVGKGFSIIAHEIRQLAADSGDFANEIKSAISEFEEQFQDLFGSINAQESETTRTIEYIENLNRIFESIKALDQEKNRLQHQMPEIIEMKSA